MSIIKSVLLLLASLLVALSPWISSLPSWDQAFSTANAAPLAGIVGGVMLAWIGKPPYKSGQNNGSSQSKG